MLARRRGACCCPTPGSRLLSDEQDGPRHSDERTCTDCLCCLLFVVAMGALWLVGRVAFIIGDPSKLYFGTDHLGRRCGVGELASTSKVYFPRLSSDLLDQQDKLSTPWRLDLYGVCVENCPTEGAQGPSPKFVVDTHPKRWPVAEGTVDFLNRCVPIESTKTRSATYCALPTCRTANERCVDVAGHEDGLWLITDALEAAQKCERTVEITTLEKTSVPNADGLVRALGHAVGTASSAVSEVSAARDEIIVCGVALAVLGGVVWLLFLRLFAGAAVWSLLVLSALVLVGSTFACALRGGLIGATLVHSLFVGASEGLTVARDGLAEHVKSTTDEPDGIRAGIDAVQHALGHAESFAVSTIASAESESEAQLARWAAVVLGIVAMAYVLLICCMRRSIVRVVAIVSEATKVLAAQPSMILLPLASLLMRLLFLSYAIAVLANVLTSQPTPRMLVGAVDVAMADTKAYASVAYATFNDQAAQAVERLADAGVTIHPGAKSAVLDHLEHLDPSSIDADSLLLPLLSPFEAEQLRTFLTGYVIFASLWMLNFLHFFAWTSLAGATTHWFFFREHPGERPCCGVPLLGALWRTFRYHLGSVALGSLLVAVVQFVRFLFEYMDAQCKRIKDGSRLASLLLACTRCCLWCFEQCLKFITSYAFVFVALNGDSFCVACKDTFGLLTSYPASALLITLVQGLLFVVQSIVLPLLCALAGYRLVDLGLMPQWLLYTRTTAAAAAKSAHGMTTALGSDLRMGEGTMPDAVSGPIAWVLGSLANLIEGLVPSVLSLGVPEGAPTTAGTLDDSLNVAPLWPAVAIFIIAFVVSRSFASVYECAVSSVFVCAMRDESDYGAAYMSVELHTALGLDTARGGGIIEGTINVAERLTGWDLDGDGDIGEAWSAKAHSGAQLSAQRGGQARARADYDGLVAS